MGVNVPSGYKQTKVGVIPKDWEALPAKNYFAKSIKKGYDGLEIYSVTLNVSWQKRSELDRDIGSDVDLDKSLLAVEGDLVYNTMRMWQGALGLAENTGVVSPAYIVLKPKEMIDSKFAFYQLKSYRYLHYLKSYSYGLTSDRLRLYFKDFGMIPFVCPPLKEQQKIAKILTTWDDAISKQEELIKAKETLKKGLMQKLLSGEIRFDGFDGEWEEVKLGDLGKIVTGTTPPTNNKEYYDDATYPWITPTDITSKKDILVSKRFLSKVGLEKGRFVPAGSLLVTCIASIGKNAILRTDGSCNQQINAIYPSPKNYVDYLYYLLEYYSEYLLKYAGKSATPILNKKTFSNLKFNIPFLEEQQKIAQVLTFSDKEIELLKEELETLKEQKRGLMQRLLSGVVRVKIDEGVENG